MCDATTGVLRAVVALSGVAAYFAPSRLRYLSAAACSADL